MPLNWKWRLVVTLLGVALWTHPGVAAKIEHFKDNEGTLHITNAGEAEAAKPGATATPGAPGTPVIPAPPPQASPPAPPPVILSPEPEAAPPPEPVPPETPPVEAPPEAPDEPPEEQSAAPETQVQPAHPPSFDRGRAFPGGGGRARGR